MLSENEIKNFVTEGSKTYPLSIMRIIAFHSVIFVNDLG